jgi:hypothetical protein
VLFAGLRWLVLVGESPVLVTESLLTNTMYFHGPFLTYFLASCAPQQSPASVYGSNRSHVSGNVTVPGGTYGGAKRAADMGSYSLKPGHGPVVQVW